jgi:hypothetical protein
MGVGCAWATGASFSRRLPYTNSCGETNRQGKYSSYSNSVVRIYEIRTGIYISLFLCSFLFLIGLNVNSLQICMY